MKRSTPPNHASAHADAQRRPSGTIVEKRFRRIASPTRRPPTKLPPSELKATKALASPAGLPRGSILLRKTFLRRRWIGPRVKPGEVKPGNDAQGLAHIDPQIPAQETECDAPIIRHLDRHVFETRQRSAVRLQAARVVQPCGAIRRTDQPCPGAHRCRPCARSGGGRDRRIANRANPAIHAAVPSGPPARRSPG